MRRTMLLRVVPAVLALFFGVGDAAGKTFLIHAKTGLKVDDAQICAVPNVAWAALKQGYQVTILFDASGVTAIKKGGLFGGDATPLDRAALPMRERRSLAGQMSVPLDQIPKNYGEYLHFLKEKGVALYANATMMRLYKIDQERIDPAVTPIGLEKMVTLFEVSDRYAAY